MDDITLLIQTKSQFIAARKKLFRILRELKLTLSNAKTRMGKVREGFHFLGIPFQVQPAAPQSPSVKTPVAATIHRRSCRRALDRVRAMKEDAVCHPADIQRYLRLWAGWWARTIVPLTAANLRHSWRAYVEVFEPALAWVAPTGYPSPNLWL